VEEEMSNSQYKNLTHGEYQDRIATLEARVKAADDALSLAIHNKEKAENDERLGRNRIITLMARVKVLETLEPEYKRLVNKLEELEGELFEIKVAAESPCD